METKDSLKLDQYHRPMVTATDGIEILYQSRQLDNVEFVDSEDIKIIAAYLSFINTNAEEIKNRINEISK